MKLKKSSTVFLFFCVIVSDFPESVEFWAGMCTVRALDECTINSLAFTGIDGANLLFIKIDENRLNSYDKKKIDI